MVAAPLLHCSLIHLGLVWGWGCHAPAAPGEQPDPTLHSAPSLTQSKGPAGQGSPAWQTLSDAQAERGAGGAKQTTPPPRGTPCTLPHPCYCVQAPPRLSRASQSGSDHPSSAQATLQGSLGKLGADPHYLTCSPANGPLVSKFPPALCSFHSGTLRPPLGWCHARPHDARQETPPARRFGPDSRFSAHPLAKSASESYPYAQGAGPSVLPLLLVAEPPRLRGEVAPQGVTCATAWEAL